MASPLPYRRGWPVALGLLTAGGLVTALVSAGWGDVRAAVALAAPVAAIAWVFWPYRPGQAASGKTGRPARNIETNRAPALIPRAQAAIESVAKQPWLRVVQRVVGALPGGYLFVAAQVALLTIALERAGMARSEAVVSASMGGFLLYLLLLLWAFGVRSLARLWTVLAGGTALAVGAALLLR